MEPINKRKFSRHTYGNMFVDISDGKGFYSGTILDISRFGMCLNDISNRLVRNADKYTVVLSGGKKTFKLTVRPKWIIEKGSSFKVGIHIENPPWEWTSFVKKLEEGPADIWGHAR